MTLIYQYTDFFELAEQSGLMKVRISEQYPDMFAFIMKAYTDSDPEIQSIFNVEIQRIISEVIAEIQKRIDYSKFRNDVDLKKLLNIIYWTGEGYLKNAALRKNMDFHGIQKEYVEYLHMFKASFYKDEYK